MHAYACAALHVLSAVQHEFKLEREAMSAVLRVLSAVLGSPPLLPASQYLLEKVLRVPDWHNHEVHVCSRANCRGHVWPHLPPEQWHTARDDKCPYCHEPRFTTSRVAGKEELQPVFPYIDLHVSLQSPA
jgi:hypothetical protein